MLYHLTPAESGFYDTADGTRHRFVYVQLRDAAFDILSEQHYTQEDENPWQDAGLESGDPAESIPALIAPHFPDLLAHVADLYHQRTSAITVDVPAPIC